MLFREAGPPQHPVLTVECVPFEALKALMEPRPVLPTLPHLPTSQSFSPASQNLSPLTRTSQSHLFTWTFAPHF